MKVHQEFVGTLETAILKGYVLTGRHGLFATYEAFAMVVDSLAMRHEK
jgi:phosphoketolase